MAKNGELTTKQKRMIAALLSSRNIGDACETAGVGRSTLTRWLANDDFTKELNAAEAEALESIGRSLVVLGSKAAETLQTAMDDQETAPGARIRAADIVLSRLLQLREMVSLEERVKQLEDKQNGTRKEN